MFQLHVYNKRVIELKYALEQYYKIAVKYTWKFAE